MTTALMHFSQHQINGDADTCICAFCGAADGHMPELNNTRKKYMFPDACCFAGNTLNAKKLKTIECSLPLMNHPLECPSCNAAVWRFDMKKHFTIAHPEEGIPEVAILSEAEQNLIEKKKSFRKNALQKADLERLVDKKLALLPLTDFWDTKNKTWKSNVYGNFGKRNSVRMKKIFGKNEFE